MTKKPIFFDATGRRAARLSLLGWAVAVISTVLGIAFIASIVIAPPLESVGFANRLTAIHLPELVKKATDPGLLKSAGRLAEEARTSREDRQRLRHEKILRNPLRVLPGVLKPQAGRSLSIGFYETFEQASYPALKRALPYLDLVVPNWLSLQGQDMALKSAVDKRVINLVRASKPGTAIIPMLQNIQKGNWNGDDLAKVLADKTRSAALI